MENFKHKHIAHRKDRRSTPLVSKLTALATVLSLSVSLLPTTALAADKDLVGEGGGGTSTTTEGKYPYGYDSGSNLSWKIDMYVSTNANGKIDSANDVIGSSELPLVGSVMYNNFFRYKDNPPGEVWLCTDRTNELRTSANFSSSSINEYVDGYPTGKTKWNIPNAKKVNKDTDQYTLTDRSVVAHVVTNSKYDPIGLPNEVEEIDLDNYETLVQDKIEDHENMNTILAHINNSLGGNENYWDPLYAAVGSKKLGSQVLEKLNAAIAEKGTDAYKLLLPNSRDEANNKNCIVEWCVIATPVMGWCANYKTTAYWEAYVDGTLTFIGNGFDRAILGLDAYSTAQYNQTSKTMYKKDSAVLSQALTEGLNPTRKDGLVYKDWSGLICYYRDSGKLHVEMSSGIHNVANATYDLHEENPYCGIPTHSKDTATAAMLRNKPSQFATFGITAYVNEITDPSIPVYYYVYDPDPPTPNPRSSPQATHPRTAQPHSHQAQTQVCQPTARWWRRLLIKNTAP